jgi:hypothetical protein
MSNVRDATYFTTIYLQTDMSLMWQYTTSSIKTPNYPVSININKKSLKRNKEKLTQLNPAPPPKTI